MSEEQEGPGFMEKYNITKENVDKVSQAIQDLQYKEEMQNITGGDLILGFAMYLSAVIHTQEMDMTGKYHAASEALEIFSRGLRAGLVASVAESNDVNEGNQNDEQ